MNNNPLSDIIITKIGTKNFCFDLRNLVAIVNPNNIPQNYINEFAFNNIVYPIIDFYNIHKFEPPKNDEDTRILLFEITNSFFGVIVDRVLEIISLENEINIVNQEKENSHYIFEWEGKEFLLPDLKECERI